MSLKLLVEFIILNKFKDVMNKILRNKQCPKGRRSGLKQFD
jgi:hypothetical protein